MIIIAGYSLTEARTGMRRSPCFSRWSSARDGRADVSTCTLYSITRSAAASSISGITKPRVSAVLRLITRLEFRRCLHRKIWLGAAENAAHALRCAPELVYGMHAVRREAPASAK
jgi:hypothetical protein